MRLLIDRCCLSLVGRVCDHHTQDMLISLILTTLWYTPSAPFGVVCLSVILPKPETIKCTSNEYVAYVHTHPECSNWNSVCMHYRLHLIHTRHIHIRQVKLKRNVKKMRLVPTIKTSCSVIRLDCTLAHDEADEPNTMQCD